jgi:CRISPR/Cas system-associated protein endoribonuclease Cas2
MYLFHSRDGNRQQVNCTEKRFPKSIILFIRRVTKESEKNKRMLVILASGPHLEVIGFISVHQELNSNYRRTS